MKGIASVYMLSEVQDEEIRRHRVDTINSQLIYNSLITPWFIYHSKSAPQNVDCSKLPNALGLKGNSYSLNKLYVRVYCAKVQSVE